MSARVDAISKYKSARMPMRPTSLMLPIFAMPRTTVPKITGASSILISLMKPSAKAGG